MSEQGSADNELTPLQITERRAMCLDRQAVLVIVGALRAYRAANKRALDSLWSGVMDEVTTRSLRTEIEEIEQRE